MGWCNININNLYDNLFDIETIINKIDNEFSYIICLLYGMSSNEMKHIIICIKEYIEYEYNDYISLSLNFIKYTLPDEFDFMGCNLIHIFDNTIE